MHRVDTVRRFRDVEKQVPQIRIEDVSRVHLQTNAVFTLVMVSALLTTSKNGLDNFLMPTNWASG